MNFYPRTPCGVRLNRACPTGRWPTFLSTYPVRGTTRWGIDVEHVRSISIHVPRAGYDCGKRLKICSISYFYPRTPCGVRHIFAEHGIALTNFYPRTPCGVRPPMLVRLFGNVWNFYPRTPCGVRLSETAQKRHCIRYFYPRTPCGVRQGYGRTTEGAGIFLSTYPVRGTTQPFDTSTQSSYISIHVPRAGYDAAYYDYPGIIEKFLSTYPVRGTTDACQPSKNIQPNFYPRTPCGVRRQRPGKDDTDE